MQKTGRAVRTRNFVLLVARRVEAVSAPQAGPLPSRLGIVAARTTGNAVVRNRIKRLCRESFRLSPELLPAEIDLVVIAKPGAAKLGLREVQAEWAGAASRLRVECKKVLEAEPE